MVGPDYTPRRALLGVVLRLGGRCRRDHRRDGNPGDAETELIKSHRFLPFCVTAAYLTALLGNTNPNTFVRIEPDIIRMHRQMH